MKNVFATFATDRSLGAPANFSRIATPNSYRFSVNSCGRFRRKPRSEGHRPRGGCGSFNASHWEANRETCPGFQRSAPRARAVRGHSVYAD